MALKRLPNDVQTLLCASARVNSYKRAIEELIYNSLDAKSTSIAIRIHIQENTIQVIDNGTGITKHDFDIIGQRHMTSKLTDVATLKAAPKNYGFRGEFLANIITVSKMVKITSRYDSTEDTWAKTFVNGKENKFTHVTTRPTKGTTVDIKGFLYNLNIQKRGIDPMNELQNIKSFLEQLSLVQSHISLSLRDDSQNEIVFKIHKKRDIYQTLSTLFDIDKLDVLELQVEKDEYKVKGYIGKADKNLDLHWIYLNGKYIHTCSKLHEVLKEYFRKSLHIKDQRTLKSKKQNNDEHGLFNQNIPFYLVFISCPYIDYDISYTPKQSIIEFKKWDQINKLLEKLVKFYIGDVNLKEIKKVEDKVENKKQINNMLNQDTRDQVKKIMNKILGSNSKKLGVSQLQNGIKGKMVKRKVKKKINPRLIIPKLFLQNDHKSNNDNCASTKSKKELISENNIEKHIVQKTIDNFDKREDHKALLSSCKPRNNQKQKGPKKCQNKEIAKHRKKRELKSNNLSPAKKKNKTTTKQRQNKLNKQKKIKGKDNELIYSTDSVCKRSKIIAGKAEDFLKSHSKERNINIIYQLKNAISKRQNNTINAQKDKNTFKDILPLPPKPTKSIIEKYIINKLKTKSYKTTYDLVQTVLNSQNLFSVAKSNSSAEFYKKFHRRNNILRSNATKLYSGKNKYICNEYSVNDTKKEKTQHTTDISAGYKTYLFEENFSIYEQNKNISDNVTNFSLEQSKCINKEENICSINQNIYCTQNETSCHSLSGPLSILTFDSHRHHKNEVFITNDLKNCYAINKKQNIRFITKESRENFITSDDFKNRFKKTFKKQTKVTNIRMTQTIDESSYTIEYSKDKETMYNTTHTVNYEPIKPINVLDAVFGNTYSIHPSNTSFNQSISTETHLRPNFQSNKQFETYSIHESQSEVNEDDTKSKASHGDFDHNSKNFNFVFVSKSQRSEADSSMKNNVILEPINVCETVFYEIGSNEKEFAVSFNENNRFNDSLYDNFRIINHGIGEHTETHSHLQNTETENVSRHFSSTVKPIQNRDDDIYQDPKLMDNTITNINIRSGHFPNPDTESNLNAENNDCNFEVNFYLKNRPRYVPKGMSQIFENCRTKTVCDYKNLEKDYFEDSIYNNFANDVQVNSEIYEPVIQNVEDLTTKDIHKFQNKVKKDNASLVFDETSLKEAKVLGQADCKFIVTTMKKRCGLSKDASEYLILFDQHAVHERIRLETNLADYLKEDIWTSVAVDNIILKMSKDEILYLHNYKDKFAQLGLQWTILNENEVTMHSIPAAILGKNPREVEKVIKAVRNLIIEEINVIKLQKGCLSLYPKSIMDLVFSESCRYAIKFGDPLSKSDCVELLNALSKCKTPFQCAHGRPVMAVIMDIIPNSREYKINMESLRRFRQRNK